MTDSASPKQEKPSQTYSERVVEVSKIAWELAEKMGRKFTKVSHNEFGQGWIIPETNVARYIRRALEGSRDASNESLVDDCRTFLRLTKNIVSLHGLANDPASAEAMKHPHPIFVSREWNETQLIRKVVPVGSSKAVSTAVAISNSAKKISPAEAGEDREPEKVEVSNLPELLKKMKSAPVAKALLLFLHEMGGTWTNKKGLAMSELLRAAGYENSQRERVASLQDLGLVRLTKPSIRRVSKIQLTEKGRALAEALLAPPVVKPEALVSPEPEQDISAPISFSPFVAIEQAVKALQMEYDRLTQKPQEAFVVDNIRGIFKRFHDGDLSPLKTLTLIEEELN